MSEVTFPTIGTQEVVIRQMIVKLIAYWPQLDIINLQTKYEHAPFHRNQESLDGVFPYTMEAVKLRTRYNSTLSYYK